MPATAVEDKARDEGSDFMTNESDKALRAGEAPVPVGENP